MNRPSRDLNRRQFLRQSATLVAALPLARAYAASGLAAPTGSTSARVALVRCADYGPEVRRAWENAFDLLGGIGGLVRGKTVTVKLNLTGTDFRPIAGRPPEETSMTHPATVTALAAVLLDQGARRVRLVESTNHLGGLEPSLVMARWDVRALEALGAVEFENTRGRGSSADYATLPVPAGGRMFTRFELNRAYADTDVFVSLCKLKQHITTGITLGLKNLFGITPNTRYGEEAGREDARKGRLNLHAPARFGHLQIPGLKPDVPWQDPESRVPRIVTDLCAARPIHLTLIDGITTMSGGEGWWCQDVETLALVKPGLVIAGLDPVATDAVGTALMGYEQPRAPRGQGAFKFCDNMLLLAEAAGLGTADLSQVDIRGLTLAQARHLFPELNRAREFKPPRPAVPSEEE